MISCSHWGLFDIPLPYQIWPPSAISRTTDATLFAVYGSIYGSGDGSTTFNLPEKK